MGKIKWHALLKNFYNTSFFFIFLTLHNPSPCHSYSGEEDSAVFDAACGQAAGRTRGPRPLAKRKHAV